MSTGLKLFSDTTSGMRPAIVPEGTNGADSADSHATSLGSEQNRLALLLELAKSIGLNRDVNELLDGIVQSFRDYHGGILLMPPDQEGGMTCKCARDFAGSEGFAEQVLARRGEAERAASTLEAVVVSQGDQGQKPPGPELMRICFFPLVSRGRVLGVMGLSPKHGEVVKDGDREFWEYLGRQIGVAIENVLAQQEIANLKDRLAQQTLYLEEEQHSEIEFEHIIGRSAALRHVLGLVESVAPSDSTVLLLGETGTGKELVARAIRDHSRRKERAFVKFNCAAVPTGLLESELFGHEKGAFTGAISQKIGRLELANEGTLFLDEVGDIPTDIQPKLLRTLQEKEFERLGSTQTKKVDVRLIAASNRDLEKMIATREFRSDLYYRLSVFPIHVPALRERREDIPLLVRYFVQRFARQMQKRIETIPDSAMEALTRWAWPGNIRELQNFMERAVILTRGSMLDAPLAELKSELHDAATGRPNRNEIAEIVSNVITRLDYREAHNGVSPQLEKHRETIVGALKKAKGRVGGAGGAAEQIGVHRTTLLGRMKRLGLRAEEFR